MKKEELEDWIEVSHFSEEQLEENLLRPSYQPYEHQRKLELFDEYLKTLEKLISDEKKKRENKRGIEIEKIHNEMQREIELGKKQWSKYSEDRNIEEEIVNQVYSDHSYFLDLAIAPVSVVNEFANIQRYFFVVGLYFFFEAWMKQLRESLMSYDDDIKSVLELKKRKDAKREYNFIDQAKDLLKAIEFNLGDNNKEWTSITKYKILRDCVVHGEGVITRLIVEKDQSKLRDFVNTNPKLGLKDDVIEIYAGFCEEVLDTISLFQDKILAAITDFTKTTKATKATESE